MRGTRGGAESLVSGCFLELLLQPSQSPAATALPKGEPRAATPPKRPQGASCLSLWERCPKGGEGIWRIRRRASAFWWALLPARRGRRALLNGFAISPGVGACCKVLLHSPCPSGIPLINEGDEGWYGFAGRWVLAGRLCRTPPAFGIPLMNEGDEGWCGFAGTYTLHLRGITLPSGRAGDLPPPPHCDHRRTDKRKTLPTGTPPLSDGGRGADLTGLLGVAILWLATDSSGGGCLWVGAAATPSVSFADSSLKREPRAAAPPGAAGADSAAIPFDTIRRVGS